MKKLYYIILFSLIVNISFAQITITQADMPAVNDTIRYTNAPITNLNFVPTNTGANKTWDFSTLGYTSQDVNVYKSSFSTPYLLYFLNKIGLKIPDIGFTGFQLTNMYAFYTKSAALFKNEGLGYTYNNAPLANSYIDDDEIYQFPLQFNRRDSSTFYFDFKLLDLTNNLNYAQNGYRINEVDGWGSITTPYKNYPSVLRIKSKIQTYDTITVSGFPIVTRRTAIEYKWLSNTEKIPVLEISGIEVGANFTPTTVRYRDRFRQLTGINDLDSATKMGFTVYPNPANKEIIVQRNTEGSQRLSILNSMGQVVLQKEIGRVQNIDTQSLDAGLHFVKIGNHTEKLMIVR
jgi:hypothetical protein